MHEHQGDAYLEEALGMALLRDDKEEFLRVIDEGFHYFYMRAQEVLSAVCIRNCVRCAAALLNGETDLTVNLNDPKSFRVYPLHIAAGVHSPSVVELLIVNEAQTDFQFKCDVSHYDMKLPLHVALDSLCMSRELHELEPDHSIFKLLIVLCLPRLRSALETVGLLALTTDKVADVFKDYAKQRKLKELAALLIVAHEKLADPTRELYYPDSQQKLLLEVFLTKGDAIGKYVKRVKTGVSLEKTIEDVKCLLQKLGFSLDDSDYNFQQYKWYRDELDWHSFVNIGQPKCGGEPLDIDMQHYGKSKCRWVQKPVGVHRQIGMDAESNEHFRKRTENPYTKYELLDMKSLEELLDEAVRFDDKDAFRRIISAGFKYFSQIAQEVLSAVCHRNSVQCAAALLNGETGLVVNPNYTNSLGVYPLHLAARVCSPSIPEMLIVNEAQTDALSESYDPRYDMKLPLHVALDALCMSGVLREWKPDHSIFKLLIILCLPRLQNALETVGLLAWTTTDVVEVFEDCAKDSKLKELAALLTVAHEKLIDPMRKIDYLDSQQILLLQVFLTAGNAIAEYVKRDKTGVSVRKTIEEVTSLLEDAGFALYCVDWMDYKWFREQVEEGKIDQPECRYKPKDIGMQHYGKSSHRWTVGVHCQTGVDAELS